MRVRKAGVHDDDDDGVVSSVIMFLGIRGRIHQRGFDSKNVETRSISLLLLLAQLRVKRRAHSDFDSETHPYQHIV